MSTMADTTASSIQSYLLKISSTEGIVAFPPHHELEADRERKDESHDEDDQDRCSAEDRPHQSQDRSRAQERKYREKARTQLFVFRNGRLDQVEQDAQKREQAQNNPMTNQIIVRRAPLSSSTEGMSRLSSSMLSS